MRSIKEDLSKISQLKRTAELLIKERPLFNDLGNVLIDYIEGAHKGVTFEQALGVSRSWPKKVGFQKRDILIKNVSKHLLDEKEETQQNLYNKYINRLDNYRNNHWLNDWKRGSYEGPDIYRQCFYQLMVVSNEYPSVSIYVGFDTFKDILNGKAEKKRGNNY